MTRIRPFVTHYVDAEAPHATAKAEQEDGQFWWRDAQDDVEAVALRQWMASLHARFPGAATILHVDLHSDPCPHPDGWWAGGERDEACLYRDDDPAGAGRPSWLVDPPPAFKRCAGTDSTLMGTNPNPLEPFLIYEF